MGLAPSGEALGRAYRGGAPGPGGHERAEAVVVDGDGFVVLCTSEPDRTRLVRLDAEGEVASGWPGPEVAGRALAALPDGGFAVAGDVVRSELEFQAAVALLDGDGKVAASGSFGPLGPTGFAAVAAVDGGVVAGGTAGWAGWVVRLGGDLEVEWEHVLGDVDGVQGLAAVDAGTAVAATEERSTTPVGTARLLLISGDGGVRRQLSLPADGRGEPAALAALDGGLVAAGHHAASEDAETRLWVVRVDAEAAPVWERRLGRPAEERRGRAIAGCEDGGVAVAADAILDGKRGLRLARLDAEGNPAWERAYDGGGADVAAGVACTDDGGLVLAGSSTARAGGTKPRVMRLDGRGQ